VAKPQTVFRAGTILVLAFFAFGNWDAALAMDVASPDSSRIQKALSNKTAFESGKSYRPWRQYFAADGTTVYFGDGPSSIGKWEVRGNRYCSLWPPAQEWACYDIELTPSNGTTISVTWIAEDGSRAAGVLFKGDLTALRTAPNR
jgi:hypothetical protein